MLKIRDDFNIKELEKYKIYPKYECDVMTGKTRIESLNKDAIFYENLKFIKKQKRIAFLKIRDLNFYELVINQRSTELIDLDTLYDLIKADIVVKE